MQSLGLNLKIGDVLDGKYEILERLGSGGFASVYKALDRNLGRTVAIKILCNQTEETASERFLREAKICTGLCHANIVRVHSFGIVDKTNFYIIMEFVDGETLSEYIASKSKLSCDEAITIVRKILEGVEHAHQHGILHRDLKPPNVLVSRDASTVKITDFGLAKRPLVDTRLTQTGFVQGSPAYMSPEQFTNRKIDARGCLQRWLYFVSMPFRTASV